MRRIPLLIIAMAVGVVTIYYAVVDDPPTSPLDRPIAVDIVVPKPPGKPKPKTDEECTTGCSLAKHPVAPFTDEWFLRTRDEYAAGAHDIESQALDTLLFYGKRTEELLEQHGTGPLPPPHIEVLSRELARRFADVELRLIDKRGRIRVAYGPHPVPIGQKQHLQPAESNRPGVQPLEFNGTVMRTGLYHLWSRY